MRIRCCATFLMLGGALFYCDLYRERIHNSPDRFSSELPSFLLVEVAQKLSFSREGSSTQQGEGERQLRDAREYLNDF